MIGKKRQHRFETKLTLFTGALLFASVFGWSGVSGLSGEEPRRALVSLEMLQNQNWFFPRLLGWPYYNKPPIFNWIQALFFGLTGSTGEWVVRLPSMLAFLITGLLLFRLVKKEFNRPTALATMMLFYVTAELLYYGTLSAGELDMFFTLFVFLNAWAIFHFYQKGRIVQMFLISYLAAFTGLLIKGLPGVLFHLITLSGWLIYERRFRMLFSLKHLAGIALFLLLSVGYFLLLDSRDYAIPFIVRQFKESSQRTFLETSLFKTITGLAVNPLRVVLLGFPSSLIIIAGLTHRRLRKTLKAEPLIRFSLLFMVLNLPVYLITGDFKSRYVYPFFPFMAIAAGYSWHFLMKYPGGLKQLSERLFQVIIALTPVALFSVFLFTPVRDNIGSVTLQVLLIVAGIVVLTGWYRTSVNRLILLVLSMVFLRMGEGNVYIHALKTNSHPAECIAMADSLASGTASGPLRIAGRPMIYDPKIKFFGYTLPTPAIRAVPFMSYQIAWYYWQKTGYQPVYDTTVHSGTYTLIPERDISGSPDSVIYRYTDRSNNRAWYLLPPSGD